MNHITKAAPAVAGRTHLRVHVEQRAGRTICGIWLKPAQVDLAECNCKRCAACVRAANRRHIRGTARLNGRRVSPDQIKLIA